MSTCENRVTVERRTVQGELLGPCRTPAVTRGTERQPDVEGTRKSWLLCADCRKRIEAALGPSYLEFEEL